MEKEKFLERWEMEFLTTLKVLKAYPESRQDYKPHEITKSAKDLAWTIVGEEEVMVSGIIAGKIDFEHMQKSPATIKEVLLEYERSHKKMVQKFISMTEDDLNQTMKFFTGPKEMGDVRKMDLLWMILMDQIHHRGQFSVYLRLVGAKVPSIYGPSADEPWN